MINFRLAFFHQYFWKHVVTDHINFGADPELFFFSKNGYPVRIMIAGILKLSQIIQYEGKIHIELCLHPSERSLPLEGLIQYGAKMAEAALSQHLHLSARGALRLMKLWAFSSRLPFNIIKRIHILYLHSALFQYLHLSGNET